MGPVGSGKTTLIHQLIEKRVLLPGPDDPVVRQYKIVLNDYPMVLFDVPGNTPSYSSFIFYNYNYIYNYNILFYKLYL